MKLSIVLGTRPQIIKCVPVVRECAKRNVDMTIINTGQHYDFELSKIFLRDLEFPRPRYNLAVGSGSHGWQTGNIMIRLEKTLRELSPSVCIVPGDTNSAIAAALSAVKLKIPVAHLESGLRNLELFMAEEINRRAIDHICQLLFAPTITAKQNLFNEAISSEKIVLSGDTMYDLFLQEKEKIEQEPLPERINNLNEYIVVTMHRAENTEEPRILTEVLSAVRQFNMPTVFPIHPRTKLRLKEFSLLHTAKNIKNLILVEPFGYHRMIKLMQRSRFVITDSGGMQKEAFMTNVPCITMRNTTEWIETVKIGANMLLRALKRNEILKTMRMVRKNRELIVRRIRKSKNPYGDGKAADKVVEEVTDRF